MYKIPAILNVIILDEDDLQPNKNILKQNVITRNSFSKEIKDEISIAGLVIFNGENITKIIKARYFTPKT